MFKEENRPWLYLLGILIMFAIMTVFTLNFLFPLIRGEKDNIPTLENAPRFVIDLDQDYKAEIITNLGTITVDLYENNAPINVNNFYTLANKDFYDGLKFYRMVPGFLIQGGDPNTRDKEFDDWGKGGPNYVVRDEINLNSLGLTEEEINIRLREGYSNNPEVLTPQFSQYIVAMANDGPDTNGSQFFIILADSDDSRLGKMDGRFTPIGKVTNGFEIVNIIRNIAVNNPDSDKPTPVQDIIINDIVVTP